MSLELPPKPNLEHLKNQARDLLRECHDGNPAAVDRAHTHLRFAAPETLKLADAFHVIARDYGFATWPKLKEYIKSLTREQSPDELLSEAVKASDAVRTARVLAGHPELKSRLTEPLLGAVMRSDRETIEVLLAAGADINARMANGVGVLDECHPDLAPFLVERGAVVDGHSAARLGMFEKLREFAIDARGPNGQSVLHCASTVEIAEYLLDRGADIDARDTLHESTPAQHMVRVVQARHYPRDRQDIARFLVARGCKTDIFMAAALGDLPLVRRHLEADPGCIRTRVSQGIYVEALGPRKTPHLVARDFGHEAIFHLLMERSPEDVKLSQACELGDESLFRRPEILTEEDHRRLPDAAQSNNVRAVRLMLNAGWPVDAKGEYDLTAVQWASWHGNAAMVREILRYKPQHLELRSALNGSENSWHRDTGDYGATVEALLEAGVVPPKLTDDLEASQAIREVLRRREESPEP
jgi:ankyrin repeat protein